MRSGQRHRLGKPTREKLQNKLAAEALSPKRQMQEPSRTRAKAIRAFHREKSLEIESHHIPLDRIHYSNRTWEEHRPSTEAPLGSAVIHQNRPQRTPRGTSQLHAGRGWGHLSRPTRPSARVLARTAVQCNLRPPNPYHNRTTSLLGRKCQSSTFEGQKETLSLDWKLKVLPRRTKQFGLVS